MVELDEANYQDDADMQYILRQLALASTDTQIRQDMNAEDVYIQPLEDRDTAIMSRDKVIKEKDKQILQKNQQLSEQSQQLSEQSRQLDRVREKLRQKGMSEEEIDEWIRK